MIDIKHMIQKYKKSVEISDKYIHDNDILYLIISNEDFNLLKTSIKYASIMCILHNYEGFEILTNANITDIDVKSNMYKKTTILADTDINSIIMMQTARSLKNVCIISLDKPYGRKYYNLVNKNKIDETDLIIHAIYQIWDVPEHLVNKTIDEIDVKII